MDQMTEEEKAAETPPIRYELIIRDTVTGHAVGAAADHLYDFLKPLRGPFKLENPGVKTQIALMFRYFRKEVAAIESSKLGPEQDEPIVRGEPTPTWPVAKDTGSENQSSDIPSSGDGGHKPVSGE